MPANVVIRLPGKPPLEFPPTRINDALLRAVVNECAKRQETYIHVRLSDGAVVSSADFLSSVATRPCPLVDIMLAAEHRSIGLCTDVAIYMHLLGGRLLPGPSALPLDAYTAACSPGATARMFLEAMNEEWVVQGQRPPDGPVGTSDGGDAGGGGGGGSGDGSSSSGGGGGAGSGHAASGGTGGSSKGRENGNEGGGGAAGAMGMTIAAAAAAAADGGSPDGGVHIFAPNFENVYDSDRHLHGQMQLVLCKVRRCVELFTPYLRDIQSNATIIFTGHTAIDPSSAEPPPPPPPKPCLGLRCRRGRPAPAASPRPSTLPPAGKGDYGVFLHVRGKSELKHTAQLLDCWSGHPDLPQLTVLGPLPNPQVDLTLTKKYMSAANIIVPRPGIPSGPGWPLFDPLPPYDLAKLQLSAGVHVCPSEREGYGLYISEARAAGALVIAPDHPPMNELVTPATGILIEPERAFSQPGPPAPALGRYGNISASVSAQGICRAVQRALELPAEQRRVLGLAARGAFLTERQQLVSDLGRVRDMVASMLRLRRRQQVPGPQQQGPRAMQQALQQQALQQQALQQQ